MLHLLFSGLLSYLVGIKKRTSRCFTCNRDKAHCLCYLKNPSLMPLGVFLVVYLFIFFLKYLTYRYGLCCLRTNYLKPQLFFPVQSAGVILELSEREKFCDNFRISGRSFGPNFGLPYTFYTFSPLSAQDREKSASLGRLFLPNRPLG